MVLTEVDVEIDVAGSFVRVDHLLRSLLTAHGSSGSHPSKREIDPDIDLEPGLDYEDHGMP
jgi:hypothetical protein